MDNQAHMLHQWMKTRLANQEVKVHDLEERLNREVQQYSEHHGPGSIDLLLKITYTKNDLKKAKEDLLNVMLLQNRYKKQNQVAPDTSPENTITKPSFGHHSP